AWSDVVEADVMAQMTELQTEFGKVHAENTMLQDWVHSLSALEKEALEDTAEMQGVVMTTDE
ncbi:hypothetical protein GOP47_0030855, partial [Adiantum capillus-veneris]